jgi:hypothetical protein
LYDGLVLTIFSFLFSLLHDKQAAQSENLWLYFIALEIMIFLNLELMVDSSFFSWFFSDNLVMLEIILYFIILENSVTINH